ncbi:MAG: fatty acid desaturase [Planctomycetales bacterium]|nr:fatty acid desaturase [Planctomycetales bacterium]
MATSQIDERFSITQAKGIIKDLSVPDSRIYWADFLATILVGHISFACLNRTEVLVPDSELGQWGLWALCFAVTAILYMRAAMFIHELVHLRAGHFLGFRVIWNLFCGIPFLIPSFLYYPHVDHHRRKHYGTDRDGEYLDLSHRHPANLLLFVLAAAVVPIAAFTRFLLLTPIAWAFPTIGRWIEKRASSMVIDIFYLRGDYGLQAHRVMRIQEAACLLWCSVLTFRVLTTGQDGLNLLLNAYLMSVTLIVVNNVRTLGAHRWLGDGRELSFQEQLLDSVNYPFRPWVTELWGPTGTRYHALHHLFPSIPYHNLGIAHRRLVSQLPADNLYHETIRVSLFDEILTLWRRAANRNKSNDDSSIRLELNDKHAA